MSLMQGLDPIGRALQRDRPVRPTYPSGRPQTGNDVDRARTVTPSAERIRCGSSGSNMQRCARLPRFPYPASLRGPSSERTLASRRARRRGRIAVRLTGLIIGLAARRWPGISSSTRRNTGVRSPRSRPLAPVRASSALPRRKPAQAKRSRPRSIQTASPASMPRSNHVAVTVAAQDLTAGPPPPVDLVAVGDLFYEQTWSR